MRRFLFLLLCAGTVGMLGVPAGLAVNGVRETIVHSALRPTNWDIYLFDRRGASPRRLTDDPTPDYNAVFSPDGRWVVFCSERRGNPDLYAIDLQRGNAPRLLLESSSMEDAPAFSPDGRTLAFVGTRDGNAHIFTMPFQPDRTHTPDKALNLTPHESGNFNPAFSPDGRKIAFSSDRDSEQRFGMPGMRDSNIYVMNADGSDPKRLAQAKGWEGSPAWSADGQFIYYYATENWKPASESKYRSHIWRMNADGSDPRAITTSDAKAFSPALTRDGRIAFAAEVTKQGQEGRQWRIMSTAADGTEERFETDTKNDYWAPDFDRNRERMVCHGRGPLEATDKFAPHGMFGDIPEVPFLVAGSQTQIALPDRMLTLHAFRSLTTSVHSRTGEVLGAVTLSANDKAMSVVAARLDGTNLREVFKPAGGMAWGTAWAKDGDWLAFAAGPIFAPPQAPIAIWKVRFDGSEATNLTADCKANNGFPDFSPDNRRIVFRSGRDGNHEIYLMDADGKNARRLTDHPATDTMPSFAPSGDLIAFTSLRDGNYEIYTLQLKPDGAPGELRRITNHPAADTHPRFSPDGRWLTFASARGGINDEEPLLTIFNPQPYGEIWAMRLADGFLVRLTHNKWEDGVPAWVSSKR